MKGFSVKEKEKLIEMAKDSKVNGYSLTKVFNDFAKETSRASGSIRNYYYDLLKENNQFESSLQVNKIVPFTKCETAKLVAQILVGASGGKSVRKVIKEMANNEKDALRIQNKYRNVVKNERAFVIAIMQGLEKNNVKYLDPYKKRREKRSFIYNRLKREIDSLLQKLESKEKVLNKELEQKVLKLQEENKVLKENSKIINFYELEKNSNETKEVF